MGGWGEKWEWGNKVFGGGVMAVFHHQLDNTFHEPFINVLVAKINNLKTKIVIKSKIPMI